MKYIPKLYATALADLITSRLKPEEEKRVAANFLAVVGRNGDTGKLSQIVAEAERILRIRSGHRKVVVESARPLAPELQKSLRGQFGKEDVFETKLTPALVAGVKVTVNDELQYDGSLRRKLSVLFNDLEA